MTTTNLHPSFEDRSPNLGTTKMTALTSQHHATVSKPLSFIGVFKSECIKAFSLRSIMWSIVISVFLGVSMGGIMALSSSYTADASVDEYSTYLTTVAGFPTVFLALVFGALGVFFFSSEYASGMILSTLTATPKRGLLIAAKSAVVAVVALVVAFVVVLMSAVLSVVFLPEATEALFTVRTLSGLGGTIFFLVAVALLSFGIAGILRSTAGSITTVVGFIFIAPTIFQLALAVSHWDWLEYVLIVLPQYLGNVLGHGVIQAAPSAEDAISLGYGGAFAVMALWVVIPMTIAAILFQKRDAK